MIAPRTLVQGLRFLRVAWPLLVGAFVNRFGSFVTPFLLLYLVRKGYPLPVAGLVAGTMGIGSIAGPLIGGHLADRVGRVWTIAVSMFTSAVLLIALPAAPNAFVLAPLALLAGLAADLHRPAAAALLADLTPAGGRAQAFAVYRLAANAGVSLGLAAAGFLADRAFLLLFVGDALTSVIFGVIAVIALRPREPRREAHGEAPAAGWRWVRSDSTLMLLLVATFLGSSVFMQSIAALPLQIRAAGLAPHVYGLLLALNALLVIVFELPLVTLTRSRPQPALIAIGLALIGLGFGLLALGGGGTVLVASVLLWTAGEMLLLPIGSAYVADLAPAGMQGRYQGALGFTFGLGLVVGPAVGPAVFAWNPAVLWIGCAIAGLLAAALASRLPTRREVARTAEA